MKKIVFTGGGTAGHIMPNIAIIEQLKDYEISHSDLNKIIKEALSNIKIDDKTKELLVKQINMKCPNY